MNATTMFFDSLLRRIINWLRPNDNDDGRGLYD